MSAAGFRPFADDTAVFTLGELNVENGTDRLTMSGNAEFTRDRKGLARLEALIKVLSEAHQTLKDDPGLPADVGERLVETPVSVKNPFA